MKIKSPYFKSIIGAAGLVVATSGILAASDGGSKKVVTISLNAGETYTIKGLAADNTPAVHVLKNPNALIVHSGGPGQLVLLGAGSGEWNLDVTDSSGTPVTYKIDVKSIANPDRLAPGKAPAAMSDATGDTKAHGPVTVSSLDSGSGPVSSKSPATTIVSDTTAAPAAAPVANTASASTLAGPSSSSLVANAAGSTGSKPVVPVGASAAAPSSPVRLAAYIPPTKANDASPAGGPVIPSQSGSGMAQLPPQKFSNDPLATPMSPSIDRPSGTNFLPADSVELMSGSSQVYDFAHRIKRISVSDTEVADIQVINPYQINLIGHKEGFTTLAVWDDQGNYVQRQIRIDPFGKQQVLLNVIVAELDKKRIEGQAIDWTAALPNQGLSVLGLGPGGAGTQYTASTSLGSQ